MFHISRTIFQSALKVKSSTCQLVLGTDKMLTRNQAANFCTNKLKVYHDKPNLEFTIEILSDKAFLKYSQNGHVVTLEHTEVPKIFQNKGVGKLLANAAFDYVKSNGYKMKLECTYLQHITNQNPEEFKNYLIK